MSIIDIDVRDLFAEGYNQLFFIDILRYFGHDSRLSGQLSGVVENLHPISLMQVQELIFSQAS